MGSEFKNWLTSVSGFGSQKMEEIGFLPFLVVMLIALLSSLFISYLYTRFYKSRATGSNVHLAFPLLGISITAIFITIQFSLPLSLGLLGALSIVRFRNPIKEPEEIGFIMLVVASSLCIATFNMVFLGIILLVAVIALIMQSFGTRMFQGRVNDGMMITSMSIQDYTANKSAILNLLDEMIPKGKIDSISETEKESILSYSFIRLNKNLVLEIQDRLKTIAPDAKVNVFFNRSV